jgi:hypothetical protein
MEREREREKEKEREREKRSGTTMKGRTEYLRMETCVGVNVGVAEGSAEGE